MHVSLFYPEPNCIPRPEERAFQDRRFIFEEIGKRNDVMNDMVATKAQDTPTFVTSSQARRNDRDQGCRISSGPAVLCRTKGRTYDRSRPKRSDRQNPACKEAVHIGRFGLSATSSSTRPAIFDSHRERT